MTHTPTEDRIVIDAAFVRDNALAAATTFVAPLIGLIAAVGLAATPQIDIMKSVARMRRSSRLSLHPKELVLRSAIEDGLTFDELVADLRHVADEEAKRGESTLRTASEINPPR
jgi:hypothetical protein